MPGYTTELNHVLIFSKMDVPLYNPTYANYPLRFARG